MNLFRSEEHIRNWAGFDPATEELGEVLIKAKSSDITLDVFSLIWLPYRRDGLGQLAPDWK